MDKTTNYLSLREAVKLLPIKYDTLRIWVQQKKVPAIKYGRRLYITTETMEQLLLNGTTN